MYSTEISQSPWYVRDMAKDMSAHLTSYNLWSINSDIFEAPWLHSILVNLFDLFSGLMHAWNFIPPNIWLTSTFKRLDWTLSFCLFSNLVHRWSACVLSHGAIKYNINNITFCFQNTSFNTPMKTTLKQLNWMATSNSDVNDAYSFSGGFRHRKFLAAKNGLFHT